MQFKHYLCLDILSWKSSNFISIWHLFQDQGLDVIGEGLDTLKNMAHDMNEVCSCTFLPFLVL